MDIDYCPYGADKTYFEKEMEKVVRPEFHELIGSLLERLRRDGPEKLSRDTHNKRCRIIKDYSIKEFWELKLSKYRVPFGVIDNMCVVAGVFKKQKQKQPNELKKAHDRIKTYKQEQQS